MSFRPRRALAGLVAAAAALAVLPASALAAGEAISVVPSNAQAGGLTPVTTTLTFASGNTPKTVVTSLAPGILGNLNANASCLVGAQQLTSACQIGTASVRTTASPNPLTGKLFLVPRHGTDVVGIEFVPASPPLTNQYIGVSANPHAQGALNLTTTFPNPSPARVTGFTASFTTLNKQPFTRLPSSCSRATSTMTVTYYGSTAAGSASGSLTPTGCQNLHYAPTLTASVTKDPTGNGATVALAITQAAGESTSKTIVLALPKGLAPNVAADIPCLSGKVCTIGTAAATSPLVPNIALSGGVVTLSGTATAPTITIAFPTLGITIPGTVSLTTNSVTFVNVPDVPLTSLKMNVTGPNGQKAFTTDCTPASVTGTFTPQSGGAVRTVTAPVTFAGCVAKSTATGSTSGLASGHPKLKFTVTHGTGGPNIVTVAVGLPSGLKFSRAAIVSHKTCTTKGKTKRCSTTILIKGLGISGAKPKSVAVRGGKLVVTLKKPAGHVTITVAGPLVRETKALQTKVKKHRVKSLKLSLNITDAKKAATTVSLALRAH